MRHCALLILIWCLASTDGPAALDSERPNVLFIAIDDLNDWLGCLQGHPNAKTPNIDALARRGVLFANAHCQAPICGPSRASLFTGLLPTTTGIYGQINDKQLRTASDVMRTATFLPDYLEKFGYKTLAAGKLFHNGDAAKVFDEYGVQSSFGPKPAKRMKYDPTWFPEKIGGTQTDWGAFPDRDDQMPDYNIAQYGVEQLRAKHDQPFFLAVGFMRPHVPWHVPQKWFDLHPLDSIVLPPYLADDFADIPEMSRRVNELPAMPTTTWAIETGEWKNMVQAYLACTSFVDAQVGKVLQALETSQYADNTIVILWSDHGYHVGEKNRFAKQALWDRATKLPLIIAVPETQPTGNQQTGICQQSVGLVDLYPTVLELCGLPPNPQNEGHSLCPLLQATDAPWPYWTITSYGQHNHALQSDRYRFYQYHDGSREMYDHRADPNEWNNLAQLESFQEMGDNLAARLPKGPAPPARSNSYPINRYFIDQAVIDANTPESK
ncbi:MAG: sulfatase [Planctomycetales bacterium]|nr:sulfatase [Planctomycetales bacterium]